MAMRKDIKDRWVAKLREPGRKQTKYRLRNAEGAQCCLDVLCEVAIEDEILFLPVWESGSYGYPEVSIDGFDIHTTTALPLEVRYWAGLECTDPLITRAEGLRCHASYLNDDLGYSFTEIADLIESDETL